MSSLVRKWGEHILRSRQYAAGAALVFAFFSFLDLPVGWISGAIIALVTLQSGTRQGLNIMVWAMLPALAMLYLGQYALFCEQFVLHMVLVFCLAIILRMTNAWMTVLKLSALLGIVAVVAIHFMAPELQAWLAKQITGMTKDLKSLTFFNMSVAQSDALVKTLCQLATGLVSLSLLWTNLMTLFLARWWQSLLNSSVNVQKEFYQLRVHPIAVIALLALMVGLHFDNALFSNVLIVAAMPFIIAGLSLLHTLAATKKNGNTILFAFYMLFFFLSPYVMAFLTLVGVVDSFVNFRKRVAMGSAPLKG